MLKLKNKPHTDYGSENVDRATAIASAYPATSSFASSIVSTADRLRIDAAWLANVMNFESGFSTSVQNKLSRATGLIQFMPATAKGLGTTVEALRQMTPQQQMVYVEKYFNPQIGKMNSQEDVYMAVFYPKAIGKPDFVFSAKVQAMNHGIKTPRDYANMANKRAKLTSFGNYTSSVNTESKITTKNKKPKKKKSNNVYIALGISALLIVGGLIYRSKKVKELNSLKGTR